MNKTKSKKGITLIALVITIIILLILAIVTIDSIKESNIITYAQKAAVEYKNADILEKLKLAIFEVKMKMIESPNLDYKTVLKETIENAFQGRTIIVEESENKDGYIVTIVELDIQYFVKSDGAINEYMTNEKIAERYSGRWVLLEMQGGNVLGIYSDNITEIKLEKNIEVVRVKDNEIIDENYKIDIEDKNIGIWLYGVRNSLQKLDVNNLSVCFGEEAFSSCSKLTEVANWNSTLNSEMPDFEGCTNLKTMSIPYGITKIGMYAFNKCTNLQSVTIPSSVATINSQAFQGCTALTSISINKAIDSISGSPWGATNATVTWAQ